MTGLIVKGIGGFYYVESAGKVYTCTARGRFRKEKLTPLAGDWVEIALAEDETGAIEIILPRKNKLIRPPVANIERLIIVSSVKDPSPDTFIIDKTIASAELESIEPVLVLTKTDIESGGDIGTGIKEIYDRAGVTCIEVSSVNGEGVGEVKELLRFGISALTGNSGVGKSTLLNAVFPGFSIKTGETSKKLGRGRHTTREVELYKTGDGGYVADTPGFSSFDTEQMRLADKENLMFGFREFTQFFGKCKFSSCSHTCEKGCAVIDAVKAGIIPETRFKSYVAMYNEVKDVKEWQQNKNA